MEVLENDIPQSVDFTPCSICGRTFNPEVLIRHERVCSQQASKKRPVFDTAKKRVEGTELQSFLAGRPHLRTDKPSTAEIKAAERKKNWRRKHEDFMQSIKSARDYTEAAVTGNALPLPRPSKPNPDYVQCPHCERRFEEYAGERHIPFCKEQHSRIERKTQSNKALEKLNKRTQYKPPPLKKKSSTAQQDTPPSKPAGYHIVTRNSNFGGTYTIDEENSPEKQTSYQSPYRASSFKLGTARRGPTSRTTVPKSLSHGRITSHASATSAGDSTAPEAGTRDHAGTRGGPVLSFGSSDDKAIRRRRSQLRTPQPVAAGYMTNNWDTLLEGGRGGGGTGRDGFGRQITENSGGQFSSSSSVGDGEAPRLTPVKPKGKSRRPLREHENSPPPAHNDIRYNTQCGSRGEERVDSGSRAPLNQHGMTMGKFCYECGAKYPVPQAKYCCICGTKRI